MPPLELSEDEVQQLQALAHSRSLPHSIVQRAQIVLACGAGETNTAIAKRMGVTGMTVGKWRKRYRELGLEGLRDELRSGGPRTYVDDQVAKVINRALQTRPTDGTPIGVPVHWLLPPASPKARCTAGCKPSRCSPTGRKHSSFRLTRSLSRRSATSSAST